MLIDGQQWIEIIFQQNYMLLKSERQAQTATNSPCRNTHDFLDYNISNTTKNHLLYHSTRQSTMPLSDTEHQIYSHQIIKQIMAESRKRSIPHDINRIDDDLALYARPIKSMKNEFKFDSIPSRNRMYSSDCYHKVKSIKEGLQDHSTRTSIVTDNDKKSKRTNKNRPLSAASRVDTKNPKVSVSGLASYNFKTVNGGKSLGFSKVNHEQNMVDRLIQQSKRQYCAGQRANKILSKTSGRRFTKHIKNQEAIMKDFQSSTGNYLKDMRKEEQENTLIYNQKLKKLNFIKEYMSTQQVDYEVASHIVNQIELDGKQKKEPKKQPQKKQPNDQALLSERKKPIQRKPLLVRHFLFIQ